MYFHRTQTKATSTAAGTTRIPRLATLLSRPMVLILCLFGPLSAQDPSRQGFTLEELLEIGRERNPTVLALKAEAAAQDAGRRDARRLPNPEIHYELGTGDPIDSPGSRSLRGFSVQQTIENPFKRHFRMKAMDRGAEAAGEDVRSGIVEVEYEIRLHYFRILYLQELVRVNRLNEDALDAIRELIETRAELGEVRELEAIRLRVEHLRARNESEASALELDQFRRHLNTFLGNVLPDDYSLLGELAADPFDPDLEALSEEAVPRHPALVRAAKEREKAQADLEASNLAWIPDPVISGSSARELDGDVRRFGVGIQIPLWNQSRAAAERDRRRVEGATRMEEALRSELRAQLMIHHNQLRLSRQTLQLFDEGLLAEAEASMEIAEVSYREGEISLVEYLDARRTYHSIQIEYQLALYDWNRERAEFDRAVGGGTL